MVNPLDANHILDLLPTLLPRSTSSPLPHTTDALAALVHTIHTALKFRLVSPRSNDDEESSNAPQDSSQDFDDAASETTTAVDHEEAEGEVEGRLWTGWNHRAEDSYTFEYKHEQSSMTFRLRVGRMGGRVQIDAMAEDGAPHTISVVVRDLLDPGSFPIPSSATSEGSTSNSETPAKSLGFTSVASVKDFIEKYKREIIVKLLPGLQVPGYDEPQSSSSSAPPPRPGQQPAPANPTARTDPVNPLRSGPHPASVGHRDLDPLASHPHPGNFNPNGDGGGMYVDFNHPLFDSRRRGNPDMTGPGGSIQPPGSRWDPVGPGSGGMGGFPGAGRNPMGGMGVGDPDFDELLPPGQHGPDLSGTGGPLGMGTGIGRGRGGGPGGAGGMGGGFGGLGGPPRFGENGGAGGFGGGSGGMFM